MHWCRPSPAPSTPTPLAAFIAGGAIFPVCSDVVNAKAGLLCQ